MGDSLCLQTKLDASEFTIDTCENRIRRKGFEYLTEALLQADEIKDVTLLAGIKNRFLAYLGLNPYVKEDISSLESWLIMEKTKNWISLFRTNYLNKRNDRIG